jgi:cell wall-associated NlpC family hydrolase
VTVTQGRLTFFKTASVLAPLALAGSLLLTPIVSHARISPAQLASHNARLAKIQAQQRVRLAAHNAQLVKAQAKHQAQIAAHEAKMLVRQHNAQAHLAKIQAKSSQKYAKLHMQHVALTSGNVVEAAYAFRGTRYVMGGTSRSGFDCSGFVRYILSNAGGVEMPRTAVEQFYHGTPIAPDAMQPGDLVFFKNTYKHGISHVGIYAGNGQFIHAANAHKGVRMDSLSDSYYVAHFAGARRVLPAQMRAAAFLGH